MELGELKVVIVNNCMSDVMLSSRNISTGRGARIAWCVLPESRLIFFSVKQESKPHTDDRKEQQLHFLIQIFFLTSNT